jgi:hypothetical protein
VGLWATHAVARYIIKNMKRKNTKPFVAFFRTPGYFGVSTMVPGVRNKDHMM